MTAHTEPDGSLVVTYQSGKLSTLLFMIGSIFALTLAYDVTLGTRGTERAIGLVGALCTCYLSALLSLESSRFAFDPGVRTITWRRRWGWSQRSGTIPFEEAKDILVQSPIGDSGTPSRRLCLKLVDGKEVPLTVGYRPDSHDSILGCSRQIRTILGASGDATGAGTTEGDMSTDRLEDVRSLVRAGNKMDAVKLLRQIRRISLTEAVQQVEKMKQNAS